MIEQTVDLWTVDAQARVITTNGYVRRDGALVMGRGCAKEAAVRFPNLPYQLGAQVRALGNVVHLVTIGEVQLVSFPVKRMWNEPARLDLIERSLHQLVAMTNFWGWKRVALPRPGCGNGQLRYEDVRPLLLDALDDRFLVVTK
jgi:hypothetical protein